MAEATKKEVKALVKQATRDALDKVRGLKDQIKGKSELHPLLGGAAALGSGAAFSYADARLAEDDQHHPASWAGLGAGVVTTIGAMVAKKPSLMHGAMDVTLGPAMVLLNAASARKGREHRRAAQAKASAKAPPAATAGG